MFNKTCGFLLTIFLLLTILSKAQNGNKVLNKYCKEVISRHKLGKTYRYRQITHTYYYSNKDSILIDYGKKPLVYSTTYDKSKTISLKDTIVDVSKDLSVYKLKYIGNLIDVKGNIFKVVTNFMRWAAASRFKTSAHGASFIYLFDANTNYIGSYRMDEPEYIKNNMLWLDKDQYYLPSFNQGIPPVLYPSFDKEYGGIPFLPND